MQTMKTHVARIKFKIVLLGDQGVGKTAIINRFINDTFNSTYDVVLSILRPPSALTSWSRTSLMMTNSTDSSYGTQQARNALKA